MPRITNTGYPVWKQIKSTTPGRPGVENDDDPRITCVTYVMKDPDDPAGALGDGFNVPAVDYDWAIDPTGNVCPVLMSTNRVDSRHQCDSNHAALQKTYKTGKGWVFYPGKSAGTVDEWVESNRALIERRRAKHLRSQKRTMEAWRPQNETLAAEIASALRKEAESAVKIEAERQAKKMDPQRGKPT